MVYLGEWSTLTGAGVIGDTVTYNRSLYTLLVNIADLTTSTPSPISSDYVCSIGATPMTKEVSETITSLKTFNRTQAVIFKGLAAGTPNAVYFDFVDSGGNLQGRVGQLSSGSDETYLYNNIDGAGIRLGTVNGFVTMSGIPRSSTATDVSSDDNIINYGTMKTYFASKTTNNSFTGTNSFVETTLSVDGGVGVNDRVRFSVFYSGGGSGYGGSLLVQTRNASNSWVDSLTIDDAGLITSATATGVTASSIANVDTLDARYRAGSNVTFSGNGNNIILKGASAGVAATPYLRFYDSNDVALGYFGVGSSGNNNITMACEQSDAAFNVVTGGEVNFKVSAAGYCNLGTGAPSIKMKKLTGTTGSADGAVANMPHGLTSSKIIGISVLVTDASGNVYSSECTEANKNYRSWFDATNVVVKVGGTDVRGRPITALVTYAE